MKISRITSIIASVLLIAVIASFSSCIAISSGGYIDSIENEYPYDDENIPNYEDHLEQNSIKWEYDEQNDTVTDGKETYYRYEIPEKYIDALYPDCRDEEIIIYSKGEYSEFGKSRVNSGIIYTFENIKNKEFLFVTESGEKLIKKLLSKESDIIRLFSDKESRYVALCDAEIFREIIDVNQSEAEKLTVEQLKDVRFYPLKLYDDSDVLCLEGGYFFRLDYNVIYYVPVSSGELSDFFAGEKEISGYLLTDTQMSAFQKTVDNLSYDRYNTVYTADIGYEIPEKSWDILFGIFYAVLGVIVPAIGIVLCMLELFRHRKTRQIHTVRNIILTVLLALWIVIGAVMLLMLVV